MDGEMNESLAANVKQLKNTNIELCDEVFWNPELILELKNTGCYFMMMKNSYFRNKSQHYN